MGHKMGLQEEQKVQWDAGGWDIGNGTGGVGQGMGCRGDGMQEGKDAGGMRHEMTQWSNGMHEEQDREWGALEMGCVAGSMGCRQNGTPQDKDVGRAVMGTWDLGNGGDLMGVMASMALCHTQPVPPSCRSAIQTSPWSCTSGPASSPCSPAILMPCTGPSSALLRSLWCCPMPLVSLPFC